MFCSVVKERRKIVAQKMIGTGTMLYLLSLQNAFIV
jgi:hypothetical protein